MTREANQRRRRITRRTALKAGVVASSGLAFGAGIGTVRAGDSVTSVETNEIHPLHHFVRKDGAPDNPSDPPPLAPKPKKNDLLVERTRGNPVEDGTSLGLDGNQLTWREFSAVSGTVNIDCISAGTQVELEVIGLVPEGVYTVWVVVYASPGFTDARDLSEIFQHMIGAAPLGKNDGSQNVFRASETGEITVDKITDRSDTLTVEGSLFDPAYETGGCLLTDEYEWHLFGLVHLDDRSHGEKPGPDGTVAQQFAFMFKNGTPVKHT